MGFWRLDFGGLESYENWKKFFKNKIGRMEEEEDQLKNWLTQSMIHQGFLSIPINAVSTPSIGTSSTPVILGFYPHIRECLKFYFYRWMTQSQVPKEPKDVIQAVIYCYTAVYNNCCILDLKADKGKVVINHSICWFQCTDTVHTMENNGENL